MLQSIDAAELLLVEGGETLSCRLGHVGSIMVGTGIGLATGGVTAALGAAIGDLVGRWVFC